MLAFAMFMSVCGAVIVMSSAYVVSCTESGGTNERTNDSKQNSPSSRTMPNQGTSRLQDLEVMHQPTIEPDPTH